MDVLGTYIDFGPRWVQNLQMVQTDETPVSPGGFDLELQHKSAGMERANKILLDPSRRMSDREIPKGREFRQAGFGLDEGNVLRVVEEGNAGGLSNEELGVLKVKKKHSVKRTPIMDPLQKIWMNLAPLKASVAFELKLKTRTPQIGINTGNRIWIMGCFPSISAGTSHMWFTSVVWFTPSNSAPKFPTIPSHPTFISSRGKIAICPGVSETFCWFSVTTSSPVSPTHFPDPHGSNRITVSDVDVMYRGEFPKSPTPSAIETRGGDLGFRNSRNRTGGEGPGWDCGSDACCSGSEGCCDW